MSQKKVWQLIEKEENWTRFAYAKDKRGNMVGWTDPNAVCWCASGAVMLLKPLMKKCITSSRN
jgi:hypothetical protein